MWQAIISLLGGLSSLFGKLLTWFRENQLRQDGMRDAEHEMLKKAVKNKRIADAIDCKPVPDNPADILSRM